MISKFIPKRFYMSQLKILQDLAKLIFTFFPLCVTTTKSSWAMWNIKIYSGCTFFRVWIKALETGPNHLLWLSRIAHSSLCKTTAFYYIYLALSLHMEISYLPIYFSLASPPQVLRDQGWLYLHPPLWISSSQKKSWHWEKGHLVLMNILLNIRLSYEVLTQLTQHPSLTLASLRWEPSLQRGQPHF